MAKLDHWNELWLAERWARVGEMLSRGDPVASGLAWARAANGYAAYHEAYEANLPASRWDHDYGPELSDARARARARCGPVAVADGAKARSALVALVVEGQLDEAAAALQERPRGRLERAVAGLLAAHCSSVGRALEAKRLEEWSKATPLADLGGAIARAASLATGEPLSHLDYPPRSAETACITIGVERERLWRGVALLVERGPLRAAYVSSAEGDASLAFELEEDDTDAVAVAVAAYLKALGDASPRLDVVNVVCDGMQILSDHLEVPRGRWLPRFVEGEVRAGEPCACIDLDGPPGVAWTALVTFRAGREPGGSVVIAVAPAYGTSGLSVEVSSTSELIAASPAIVLLVRTVVEQRAIAKAGAPGR